ncbi:hypothetical protein OUZ56_003117 [Daphnia magna]|uniref:Uncharacterized protein n=1 Tax=Daphnia magna TaxID=35525 RepID=A0ABR0A7S7_9CRUS|nr:hypothetical protein OUZ56_003117 [Daphnia magna]
MIRIINHSGQSAEALNLVDPAGRKGQELHKRYAPDRDEGGCLLSVVFIVPLSSKRIFGVKVETYLIEKREYSKANHAYE